jgi:hypothetical protein
MKTTIISTLALLALVSCNTTQTAATGTATTVGHAAQGVGRTAVTAGTGVAHTVGGTVTNAGTGIAEGDLHKSTVGTVKTAGKGTATTVVGTGKSHVKTTKGVVKDTGKTVEDTGKAASGQ